MRHLIVIGVVLISWISMFYYYILLTELFSLTKPNNAHPKIVRPILHPIVHPKEHPVVHPIVDLIKAVIGNTCLTRLCSLVQQRRINQTVDNYQFYSETELKLTNTFIINKHNYCGDEYGIKTNLITIVYSTVSKFSRRNAIRKTWGGALKAKGVNVLFLTAISVNEALQRKVEEEDSIYNDLIQSPFIDDYYNETLKAIAMLNTLKDNCRKVKFVLKTDEDVIINVNNVFNLINKYNNSRKTIFGAIFHSAIVIRDMNHKWYVPSYVYKPDVYPDYPNGPIYMFTGDSIIALKKKCYTLSPFYIDDVYLMGVVAEETGVRRIAVDAIGSIPNSLDEDSFKKNLGVHSLNDKQILKLWSNSGL